MSVKRVIPCLDLKDGRVVKGTKFVNLRDAGDPVETAAEYCRQGADEVVLLDISATNEKRKTMLEVVEKAAKEISIPITVGGGISSIEDFEAAFNAGADKVSINSAAFNTPSLISEASKKFGSKKIVVAIDAGKTGDKTWTVLINGGNTDTGKDAVQWAIEVQNLGAGEILLTSMDCDGVKEGYDIELTRAVSDAVDIPVTASGGAGKLEDFYDAVANGKADAVLAASLFHFGEVTIPELKEYLKSKGVQVQ